MELFRVEQIKVYDVLYIAFVMLVVDAFMYFWNNRGTKLSSEELELLQQYNEQVHIVNRLNSVDTFVEQSKAIRKMNNIKKQMQELAGNLSKKFMNFILFVFQMN